MNTVKACPICGRIFQNHCYHEPQEEVATVEMPPERCLALLDGSIANLENRLAEMRDDRMVAIRMLQSHPSLNVVVDSDVDPQKLADCLAEVSAVYTELSGGDELVIKEEPKK